MRQKIEVVVSVLAIALIFPMVGYTQGLILPSPARDVVRPDIVSKPELRQQKVEVQIDEQVAQVHVAETFHNAGSRAIEGVYYFPLPHGAQVSNFSMFVDGKKLDGEMLSAADARKMYDDIVRRRIDPALLEYVDYQLFRANIFPIPPGGDRQITLTYEQVLPAESGSIRFVYPLRGEMSLRGARPAMGEQGEKPESVPSSPLVIDVQLNTSKPLQTIYSPSHEVDVQRDGDRRAHLMYEGDAGSRDFVLVYSFSERDFGLSMLTHRPTRSEPGFFMVLLSPRVELPSHRVLPKDLIFVLDTSGSMQGDKIDQAREALRFCINHLNPGDRFNIVTYSSDVRLFRDQLVGARDDRLAAMHFLDEITAKGGTNINEALLTALSMVPERKRPTSIIFLTDGLPTTGVTRIEDILANVRRANASLRIFSFGVGYDVNTRLLDALADGTHGGAEYIAPEENIEARVSEFYQKISRPVLAELELDFGDLQVEDVHPQELSDLFVGSQVTVIGRYRSEGKGEIGLSGKIGEQRQSFRYQVELPRERQENDFLPRLWAARRIGYLVDQIRLNGERPELKEEIVQLSKKYGVMSPYTSLLVQEDEPVAITSGRGIRPHQSAATRLLMMQGAESLNMVPSQEVGADAVAFSKAVREMKKAEVVSGEPSLDDLRKVKGRTLTRNAEGYWVDTAYDENDAQATLVHLRRGSDAVVALLTAYPQVGPFLALGDRLVFKLGDAFIKIDDKGMSDISKDRLHRLIGI